MDVMQLQLQCEREELICSARGNEAHHTGIRTDRHAEECTPEDGSWKLGAGEKTLTADSMQLPENKE